jgi:AcrR family transcriptional regulator
MLSYDNEIVFKSQKAEDRIKKKFLAIYKNKSLDKIRISNLIKDVGISRAAFYLHFSDIYDLYRKCEQDMIDFLEMDLSEAILSTVTRNHDKYIHFLINDLKRTSAHIEMLNCFLRGSEAHSFRQAWFESIRRNYAKSMEFSKTTSPSVRDHIIVFYAGGHLELLSNWVLSGCKTPAEDIAYVDAQVMFQGTFLKTDVE